MSDATQVADAVETPVVDAVDTPAGLVDVDAIIAALDVTGRVFPEAALRAAQRHRELATPRLIEALRNAVQEVQSKGEVTGNLHWFGVMLLTEFRVRETFPLILEGISLPGEQPYELFGDLITENLAGMLALFVDSPDELDRLIDNPAINQYVRWAATTAYRMLVRDGRLSRAEAVERLRRLLRNTIANSPQFGECDASGLVSELSDLASPAALPEIEEAYRLNLVDEYSISLEEVRADAARDEEAFTERLECCRNTGVVDTVAELRGWFEPASLDTHTLAELLDSQVMDVDPVGRELDSFEEDIDPFTEDFDGVDDARYDGDRIQPVAAIRRTEERVGRNEPCPCGSGKKFKKCCGGS